MLISPLAALYAGVVGLLPSAPGAGIRGSAFVGSTVVQSGPALIDVLNELTAPAIGAVDQFGALPVSNVAPSGPSAMAAIVSPTVRIVTPMMLIRIR